VVTVHGLDWQREKWGTFAKAVLRLGEFCSVRFPNSTIVVSKALREHFLQEHNRQTIYIPNGISPPTYREPEEILQRGIKGDFVLFVGRLVPEKGCHTLLKAHANLPSELQDRYSLVIAGDAGFTDRYVEELHQIAKPGVFFLGYVHGPILEELYSNASLVVLPSTLEGLSITLLEGMSYGRCCLASDIPPNREVSAGHTPLFRSGNLDELTSVMGELLNHPEKRQAIGQESQIHAIENYSWEAVAQRTAELYRKLAGVPISAVDMAFPDRETSSDGGP
jgi:glycosyltransferase involved in cell wall biosynthesis